MLTNHTKDTALKVLISRLNIPFEFGVCALAHRNSQINDFTCLNVVTWKKTGPLSQ